LLYRADQHGGNPNGGSHGQIDQYTNGGKHNHVGLFTETAIVVGSFVVRAIIFSKVFPEYNGCDTTNGGKQREQQGCIEYVLEKQNNGKSTWISFELQSKEV
jgi:hypothetical protein